MANPIGSRVFYRCFSDCQARRARRVSEHKETGSGAAAWRAWPRASTHSGRTADVTASLKWKFEHFKFKSSAHTRLHVMILINWDHKYALYIDNCVLGPRDRHFILIDSILPLIVSLIVKFDVNIVSYNIKKVVQRLEEFDIARQHIHEELQMSLSAWKFEHTQFQIQIFSTYDTLWSSQIGIINLHCVEITAHSNLLDHVADLPYSPIQGYRRRAKRNSRKRHSSPCSTPPQGAPIKSHRKQSRAADNLSSTAGEYQSYANILLYFLNLVHQQSHFPAL